MNTNYVVLIEKHRDQYQMFLLAWQMFPYEIQYFLECLSNATTASYGYLLVDFKTKTPDKLRLRTDMFTIMLSCCIPKNKWFSEISADICRNVSQLNLLYKALQPLRKVILSYATNDFIHALSEIALNVLKGKIPLTTSQYRRLKKGRSQTGVLMLQINF